MIAMSNAQQQKDELNFVNLCAWNERHAKSYIINVFLFFFQNNNEFIINLNNI